MSAGHSVVLPPQLSRISEPGPSLYLQLQSEHGIELPQHEMGSGPLTDWIATPLTATADVLRSMEEACLLDIGPDGTHVRLRLHNNGGGAYMVDIDPSQDLDGFVRRWTRLHLGSHGTSSSPKPGFIYTMAGSASQGPYKVGLSINPNRRSIEVAKEFGPANVIRQWHTDDMLSDESALHDMLRDWDIGREWFNCPLSEIDAAVDMIGLEAV